MKKFTGSLLILSLCTSATFLTGSLAHAETPLAAQIRVSGLRPGDYVGRSDNPDGCDEGNLTMRDDGTGVIILMLGARLFIPNVGRPEIEKERGGYFESSSRVSEGRIDWRRDGHYPDFKNGERLHFKITVITRPNGFRYVALYRGKFITCELDRVR